CAITYYGYFDVW
nr:immunoglobulin heavy chain junction region [Mus musculus]